MNTEASSLCFCALHLVTEDDHCQPVHVLEISCHESC